MQTETATPAPEGTAPQSSETAQAPEGQGAEPQPSSTDEGDAEETGTAEEVDWKARFEDVQASRDKVKARNKELESWKEMIDSTPVGELIKKLTGDGEKAASETSEDGQGSSLADENKALTDRVSQLEAQLAEKESTSRRSLVEATVLGAVPPESREAAAIMLRGMSESLDDGAADVSTISKKALEVLQKTAPQLFAQAGPRPARPPNDYPGGPPSGTKDYSPVEKYFQGR